MMATRGAGVKFPIWRHPTGPRARTIQGRTCCFGTDRDATRKRHVESKDDPEAGRLPPRSGPPYSGMGEREDYDDQPRAPRLPQWLVRTAVYVAPLAIFFAVFLILLALYRAP